MYGRATAGLFPDVGGLFFRQATAPHNSTSYAQWRGWMDVVGALRRRHPEMVVDHRLSAHALGPWYQEAGSYSEPIAGDENPETYGIQVVGVSRRVVGRWLAGCCWNTLCVVFFSVAGVEHAPPQRGPASSRSQWAQPLRQTKSGCACVRVNERIQGRVVAARAAFLARPPPYGARRA